MFSRIGKYIDKQIADMDLIVEQMKNTGQQLNKPAKVYMKSQQIVSKTVNGQTERKEIIRENINGETKCKTREVIIKPGEQPIIKEIISCPNKQLMGKQLTDKPITKYKVNKY